MANFIEIVCGIAAIAVLLYYYMTAHFNFWKKRGIRGPAPTLIFGNLAEAFFERTPIGDLIAQYYNAYKRDPVFGIFERNTPVLVINDLDLIKDVLIKDFSKFTERGFNKAEKAEPLALHLFNLDVKRWRALRSRLSPCFSSIKLKDMFSMIVDVSQQLEKVLDKVVAKGEPVEVRDLTGKFTTDVIGTCAFGIDMQSLDTDEDTEFRRMGKEIFMPKSQFRTRLRSYVPELYNALGFLFPVSEVQRFFMDLTTDTIKYRKENNIVRNDFINILMELKDHPEKMPDIELTDILLAAQAFVFFAAGFETSSTTMSNALYELAMNPEIQDKLRAEILETYEKSNGDLQYDTIKNMQYLDQVFKETLRKYPPLMILMRQATDDYTFKGTKLSIRKGQKIWISAWGIQHDPDIYPDPEVFDPNRYTEEAQAARHPMSFLPFGDGPRNCIGARFAVYQTKVGIIQVIRNYVVEKCELTPNVMKNHKKAFLFTPSEGIHLKFKKYVFK